MKAAVFGPPDPLVRIVEHAADGTVQRTIIVSQAGNVVLNGVRVGTIDASLIRNIIHTCAIYDKSNRYGDRLSPQHYAKITVNTKAGRKEIHAEDSMPIDLSNFIAGIKTVIHAGTQYANLGF